MTSSVPAKNGNDTKQIPEEALRYERITEKNIHEVPRRPDQPTNAETSTEAIAGNLLAPHPAPGNHTPPPPHRNR